MTAETLRELARVLALPALGTAHMERLTDEQTCDMPRLSYFFQLVKVIPNTSSLESFETLRRDSKLVSNSKPDPFSTYIERQDAAVRAWRVQVLLASI